MKVDDLLQTGIGLALISVMLTGVGLIAGWLLRKRGPIWRSMAYRCTIACLLAAAVLTGALSGRVVNRFSMVQPDVVQAWTPNNEPVVFHNTLKEPTGALPIQRTDAGTPAMPAAATNIPASPAVRPHTTQERLRLPVISLPAALIYLWTVGIAAGLLWLCSGALSLIRLHAKASVVNDDDLTALVTNLSARLKVAAPRVMVGRKVISPFLTGIWKPVIYLPEDYSNHYDQPTLRAIIAHELTHLANRDFVFLYLSRLCLLLFWINPLVWLLHKRLDLVSEEICDATVVTLDCPPAEYANSLLSLAERLRPTAYAFAIGAVPVKSTLGKRIKAIMASSGSKIVQISRRAKAAIIFLFVIVLLLAVAALCPSRVIRESKKALIISLIGEYPEHYADNFTLVKEKGWSIGPAYCDHNPYHEVVGKGGVVTWERENNIDNPDMANLRLDINNDDLQRMLKLSKTSKRHFDELHLIWGSSYKDIKKNIKTYTTDTLTQNPKFRFYIEDCIAGFYYEAKDLKNYSYWHNKSLDDAPAILAGQVLLENGKPAGNFHFCCTISFNNHKPQDYLDLQYNVVTDKNGVYYIPIFYTDYDMYLIARFNNSYRDFDLYRPYSGNAYSKNRRVSMMLPYVLTSNIEINGKWSHDRSKPTIISKPVIDISWKQIPNVSKYDIDIWSYKIDTDHKSVWQEPNEIKTVSANHASMPIPANVHGYFRFEIYIRQRKGDREYRESDPIYIQTPIVRRTQ